MFWPFLFSHDQPAARPHLLDPMAHAWEWHWSTRKHLRTTWNRRIMAEALIFTRKLSRGCGQCCQQALCVYLDLAMGLWKDPVFPFLRDAKKQSSILMHSLALDHFAGYFQLPSCGCQPPAHEKRSAWEFHAIRRNAYAAKAPHHASASEQVETRPHWLKSQSTETSMPRVVEGQKAGRTWPENQKSTMTSRSTGHPLGS